MEDLLEEPPAEQQLTVTEEFLQIIEDFADYIDKFMFEIVTFLAVVDSSMGLVKDLLGLFGFEGWKMAFFPSFSFVVTFSVFLFGAKKRKGKRDEDDEGLGQALNILEDVVEAVEDVAEGVEEEIEGEEKQQGDNPEGEQIKEHDNEEGGEEGGKNGPPDGSPPQSTVRRVIGLVVMTASVVIKLKRSLSKKQNGGNEPAEQQTTKNIEDNSDVAIEIRTKMPTEKSGGLNQSYAIPDDVTLEDIKNESVDIFKDEIAAVEKGITSVAEGVGKTSAIVSETLVNAEQQGIQTLDSVSLGAKKLKNDTFAIQEEIASTATGVLSGSTGVPQTLINTTQNITAINDIVGITTDMLKKPEESVERLKAETEVMKNFTLDESTKMATNATSTAATATSKAKEGVQTAKKRSGGIIQIGVRLIRLVVRVANKNKKQTSESTSSGSAGKLSAPATAVSAEGVTQAARDDQVGGPDVVAALGSLTTEACNSSNDPASTAKKVVGLLVKVVRMVKKKKSDGGDIAQGSVNLRVVSPDEDSDSVYYDCDSEMPPSVVCPRKAVSVSATGTQTTKIPDLSASNFISREEFEELKRALSLGALSTSVPLRNMPSQAQSQNLQTSFGQVVSEDYLLCRSDEKIPKYNTLPDVRKTSKRETAYEFPSTLQPAERDIERMQSLYLNNDSEAQLGFRSTGGSLQKVKVEDETKGRGSSVISPVSLTVASSLPLHPYFQGNNHKRYSSFDLNAPVVLHPQRQESLHASVSDATLPCRSEYLDHDSHSKDDVNIQSTGCLAFPKHTAINTNLFKDKVVPQRFLKSSSLDIEKQQITDTIPSCCANGYTASPSESSEVEETKRFQKRLSTSVHFVNEKPVNRHTMKQAMNDVGLARGRPENHRITSQPYLSFQKHRPASVVVDIPESKLAIAFNDNRPRNERERKRSKKHRQKQPQNYENTHIVNGGHGELVGRLVERTQVSEVSTTKSKKSEEFPLGAYNKNETRKLQDPVYGAVGKKRFHDKRRSSKRKTSFSRGSKKYRLRQIGEHQNTANDIQNRYKYGKTRSENKISEQVAVGRNENVYRRSGELSRHSKFGNDSQLHVLVPCRSGTTDDVGGESSRETSDDFDPNYESTDYV